MKSFEEMMAAIEDKEKEEIQRSISVIDPDPAAAMKPLPTMLDDIEKEERAPLHPFGTPEVQGSAESVGISKFDEIVSFLSPSLSRLDSSGQRGNRVSPPERLLLEPIQTLASRLGRRLTLQTPRSLETIRQTRL